MDSKVPIIKTYSISVVNKCFYKSKDLIRQRRDQLTAVNENRECRAYILLQDDCITGYFAEPGLIIAFHGGQKKLLFLKVEKILQLYKVLVPCGPVYITLILVVFKIGHGHALTEFRGFVEGLVCVQRFRSTVELLAEVVNYFDTGGLV